MRFSVRDLQDQFHHLEIDEADHNNIRKLIRESFPDVDWTLHDVKYRDFEYDYAPLVNSYCLNEWMDFSNQRNVDVPSLRILRNPATEILPRLFLGDCENASKLDVLRNHNITAVLNITSEIPCYFKNMDSIRYCHIEIPDVASSVLDFECALSFIDEMLARPEAEGGLLVHCHCGISRSSSLILAYLMSRQGMPLREAFDLVRSKRPFIHPNRGFFSQLIVLETRLHGAPSFADTDEEWKRLWPKQRLAPTPF
eukprot:gnl/Trimastix_PCT/3425.p1 GENE.gnl/Trimastix_PCT/3425~~gnl/Trimastix_PCT/3425.p1  ORF type:complete len:254 (+),score=45.81 gnl/Trimastix_PCT/3425:32-793(+)